MTWTSGVSINKGITVQGSGEDSTVIVGDTGTIFDVNLNGGHFRLTGIGFKGSASWAFITLDGIYTSLRCDHLKFDNIPGSRGIIVGYQQKSGIKGLFDHLTVTSSLQKIFLAVYGDNNVWNLPDNYGNDNAIYVEDSAFTGITGVVPDILDGEHGARFVIRNNIITNFLIAYHDTGSTPQSRGTRIVEVYNNEFICTLSDCGWGGNKFPGRNRRVF